VITRSSFKTASEEGQAHFAPKTAQNEPVPSGFGLNVLASSLACSGRSGSEPLVGFRAVEGLTYRYETTLITAAGMERPDAAACEEISVHFDDPNDVSAWQLLQFEWRQRKVVKRLLESERFDVVHRVTPSGLKDSLLPVPSVPLVLGPILLSEPHPPAFREIIRPVLPRQWSLRAAVRRVQHGVARRVFQRWSTLNQLMEQAAVILVGTRTTLKRLPADHHSRCRLVTYSGVEHEVYRPARHKQPNRVPQLLFAGRVVPYKGVELLLRAAARARHSCRFELKIVGGGSPVYRKHCVELAAAWGLGDTVQFIAPQPRDTLVELYRAADVFCMPSVETYGIAILEAMSTGCAVLVSDLNGPGEIVEPGTGVKVPLESPEQFTREYSDQLVALIEDAHWRAELGGQAREHVVAHHDWPRIQAELIAIYDSVFQRGAGPLKPASSCPTAATAAS
jgi:glycosyltransferase involved in cell wall biosynthesis